MGGSSSPGAGGFFRGAPRLGQSARAELLAGCLELDARLRASGVSPPRPWGTRAALALGAGAGLEPVLARRRWLDLAADLVEASAGVAGRGLVLEALAMEGVAGRLLDVLLGDGPDEHALAERR